MTDGIDHDDEDEDGGDGDVSALADCGARDKTALAPDVAVDADVEADQGEEGDEVDKDGEQSAHLHRVYEGADIESVLLLYC